MTTVQHLRTEGNLTISDLSSHVVWTSPACPSNSIIGVKARFLVWSSSVSAGQYSEIESFIKNISGTCSISPTPGSSYNASDAAIAMTAGFILSGTSIQLEFTINSDSGGSRSIDWIVDYDIYTP